MRRMVMFLLIIVTLTGCSANTDIQRSSSNVAKLPTGKGYQLLLDIFPDTFNGISLDGIRSSEVSYIVEEQKIWTVFQLQTDMTAKEAANMVGENMGAELKPEGKNWKVSLNQSCASISPSTELEGLEIYRTIPISQAGSRSKLLIEDFPLTYFDFLPKGFEVEKAVSRSISFTNNHLSWLNDQDYYTWTYSLSFALSTPEEKKIVGTLLNMYTNQENYNHKEENENNYIVFTTGKYTVSIECFNEDDQILVNVNYSYNEQGHVKSEKIVKIVEDPESVLLKDLPNEYRDMLGSSLSSIACTLSSEDSLGYVINLKDTKRLDSIIDEAKQIFESDPETDSKGRSCFSSNGISVCIGLHNEAIEIEFNINVQSDSDLSYIYEIYPSEYEPKVLQNSNESVFFTEIGYSLDDYLGTFYSREWRMEINKGKEIWEELKTTLSTQHGYSEGSRDGKEQISCYIREYHYTFSFEADKDSRLRVSIKEK